MLKNEKFLYLSMFISATLCLIVSLILSVDALIIAQNPNAVLSCDINSVVSCGTVANSWQAQVLGFPNSFIGLMCEPIIMCLAIAGLNKVRFNRGFMVTANIIYGIGFVFALWLFSQSAFVIGAFCPWCLIITIGTTVTFFTITRLNILQDNLYLSSSLQKKMLKALDYKVDIMIEILFLLGMFFIILFKYGIDFI